MIEKLKKRIGVEILKLPKNNQVAINSIEWINITEEIGKRFLLTDEQINDLLLETGLVLIGLFDLDLYTLNIEEKVGLTTDTAKKITEEVVDKILTPIVEKIESLIKHEVNLNTTSWDQSINFIVSGGDYSVFAEGGDVPVKPQNINVASKFNI